MAKDNHPEKPRRDLYQEVTDSILKLLDQGVPPWRQPITTAGGPGMPTSFGSKKPYRGINVFLLAIKAWAHDYSSNYWLTFHQARQNGGKVRKGEKGSLVLFWKQHATKDRESGEEVTIPVLRHYVVVVFYVCSYCSKQGRRVPPVVAASGARPLKGIGSRSCRG
jgi:antirestriction protein ArdC